MYWSVFFTGIELTPIILFSAEYTHFLSIFSELCSYVYECEVWKIIPILIVSGVINADRIIMSEK